MLHAVPVFAERGDRGGFREGLQVRALDKKRGNKLKKKEKIKG